MAFQITYPMTANLGTGTVVNSGTNGAGTCLGVTPQYIVTSPTTFVAGGAAAAAATEIATIPVCALETALAQDILSYFVPTFNSSITALTCSYNQLLNYLTCMDGAAPCKLTAQAPCCGGGQPAVISIELPGPIDGVVCPCIFSGLDTTNSTPSAGILGRSLSHGPSISLF